MNDLVKALGYFLAANMQAVTLLWLGYKAIEYLEVMHPKNFSWHLVVWPLVLGAVAYTYYKIIKALLHLEKRDKK